MISFEQFIVFCQRLYSLLPESVIFPKTVGVLFVFKFISKWVEKTFAFSLLNFDIVEN